MVRGRFLPYVAFGLLWLAAACESEPGAAEPSASPDGAAIPSDAAVDAGPSLLDLAAPAHDAIGGDADVAPVHPDVPFEDAAAGVPPDISPPPPVYPALTRHYVVDEAASTCVTDLPWLGPCTTWWTSGPDWMIVAGETAWLGGRAEDGLTLEPRDMPGQSLSDCVSGALEGTGDEPITFACVQRDATCALVFAPAPGCATEPFPLVTDPIVDFQHIEGIGRYNSCAGHGYGCPLREACFSALKLFFLPSAQAAGTDDTIALYAPCDGTVELRFPESNTLPCRDDLPQGEQLHIVCDADRDWLVRLFHVSALPELEEGRPLVAGEPLGFANVRDCPPVGTSFDLSAESVL